MKKVILVLLVSAAMTTTTIAQSKFSIGPTAGIGSTSISNINQSNFKLGANVGIATVYSAAEHFGIGLDVKYSFEGAKWNDVQDNDWSLHYLRIPVKAIYFFNKFGSAVRPKIFAGPSFGILSSSKINNVNYKSATESFDFAVLGGAGLNIRMVKNTWFNTDLTYTHGIKEVAPTSLNGDYSNRNLMLNVGVNFGL